MSERDENLYLADMLGAARTILVYTAGRTRDELETDGMLRDAVIRQLEVLGEAASRVGERARTDVPGVPWRGIVGMRNVLIHAYHRVDNDAVWAAVTLEIPPLVAALEAAEVDPQPRGGG